MCEEIADELSGINLGDERLNKRSKHLLEALAANPQASINGACHGWADTVAAYRFFDNPAVTPEEILRPHREATIRRLRTHPVVLLVQDTSEFDFTKHPPTDARCLNKAERFGLYGHTHLAVTPDKLPLGVLRVDYFDRAAETLGQAEERSTLPIEEKESFRWLEGYRLACQLAADVPETQIVSVADREADIYDIFVEAQQSSGPRADFIIRARVERSTPERDPAAGKAAYCKVRAEVSAAPLLTTRSVELCATPKRSARIAHLEVRVLTVTVKPPHERPYLPPVTMNVVLVEEVGGPGDGTDVSWLLLTSLPIATASDVLSVIDYYAARWAVEIYFRTLKTGCRIEEIQLETQARLKNCLAMYAIIAWRVLYLTYLNRTCPTLPCTAVFDECEWKSVVLIVTKKPLPKKPPTLAEFLRLLTQLGGYNNRTGEAPPGPQPLWIGLRRMADFANAWQTFGQAMG
jgi:Transposase DNA-binding/Transposase Tn5 dimerisation domain